MKFDHHISLKNLRSVAEAEQYSPINVVKQRGSKIWPTSPALSFSLPFSSSRSSESNLVLGELVAQQYWPVPFIGFYPI